MPPRLARRTAAASALILVASAAAASAVVDSPHVDAAEDALLAAEPIGTHRTGVFDASAAEIVTFHPGTDRTFVVNAQSGAIDVLDAADPTDPTLERSIALGGVAAADGSTISADAVANSVAVREDGLAVVAVEADPKPDRGWLAFLDAESLEVLGAVRVGALPDMVTVTPDGTRAVVANEGEPADDFGADPEGSVGVVDLPATVAAPAQSAVRTADFRAWDPGGTRELPEDVRVFGPVLDPTREVSTNLEPEYVAVDPAGDVAYAALQEANAVAVVDLDDATVTDIWPLGFKDHSVSGQGLDPSDRDGAIAIGTWPVKGMYMPDGIEAYTAGQQTYLVTANEGDAREWGEYVEPARVSQLGSGGRAPICAGSPLTALTGAGQLGRLTVSTAQGVTTDAQGRECHDELYAFGSRSFSIWTPDGEQVFDSGEDFERVVARTVPEFFNSNHSESNREGRSDDKGPEPENLAIGQVGDRTYVFVGFERVGGVITYDITDPEDVTYVGYVNNRDFSVSAEADIEAAQGEAAQREVLDAAGDLGPEGVEFVSAEDSPTGQALVAVGNEVSGTTTFFGLTAQFERTEEPTIEGTPRVGEELTAEVEAWAPTAEFSWKWLRDGEEVDGATERTYTPTDADEGAELTVRVTGSAPSHEDRSRTSEPVTVLPAEEVPGDDTGGDGTAGDDVGAGDGTPGAGDADAGTVGDSGSALPDAGAPELLGLVALGLAALAIGTMAITVRRRD